MKILSDREVSTVGLLKSTLLQLDPPSPKGLRVSSFRDFMQKHDTGAIHSSRWTEAARGAEGNTGTGTAWDSRHGGGDRGGGCDGGRGCRNNFRQHRRKKRVAFRDRRVSDASRGRPGQPSAQASEAIRALEEALRNSAHGHWPMYLRTFKQMIRSLQPLFDEHQYGISSIYDLRQAHDGLLHVERNRQDSRIFGALPEGGLRTGARNDRAPAA